MIVYTTLKANKEKGNDFFGIASFCEECWTCVGALFDENGKYVRDDYDDTDFDLLCDNFTDRQIASRVLKHFKELSKDKEEPMMIWGKIFIDLDCDGVLAYEQILELIKRKEINSRSDLREIDRKAKRNGVTIRKEVCYDEENHYYRFMYVDDIIDEFFPCTAELYDTFCNNCGNCH